MKTDRTQTLEGLPREEEQSVASRRIPRRDILALAGLCIMGAILRVALIAALIHAVSPRKLWNSGTEVASVAVSILTGHGFSSPFSVPTGPTSWVGPVYPMFAVLAFKLWGAYSFASLVSLLALNLLCCAGVTVLLFFLGKRYFDSRTAWTAATLWTISFYAIGMSSKVWDSNLSVLVATASLGVYLRVLRNGSELIDWVIFGLFWAVAALTSMSLIALMTIPLVVLFVRAVRIKALTGPMLAITVMSVTIAPWTARNYARFHRLIPIRGNFGAELWYGNRPGLRLPGDENSNPATSAQELHDYVELGESEYFASRQRQATDAIRHDGWRFFRLTRARIRYFWASDDLLVGLVPLLACVGLIGLLRHDPTLAAPYSSALLLYPLPYYVTHADWNYRYPIVPTLLLVASNGLFVLIGMGARLLQHRLSAPDLTKAS